MDDLSEVDNVGMVEFFEDGDFSDGRGWDAFFLGLESDLLEGVDLSCLLVWLRGKVPLAL